LVVDPFQAYLGDDIDLANAKKVRKMMQRLSIWASTYNCAILLIGHMTKKENSKDLYRGLGSIDLVASARSVLQVYRVEGSDTARYVKHIKSSLAPKGNNLGFEIGAKKGFGWLNCSVEYEDIDCHNAEDLEVLKPPSRDEMIAELLKGKLVDGPVGAIEIQEYFAEQGIGMKTLKRIKKLVGVKSVRKGNQWFWLLEGLL